MQDFQTFLAPAKINLFLHIIGQRQDGYHLLQTVFRLLDFYDTIQLKPTRGKKICRTHAIANVTEENDLCLRAAKLLQAHTGYQHGVEVGVQKQIPMGGGLGGGSSDAATVLLALNQLWRLDLPRAELLKLGLQLGADVPFFIFGTNAWAEGIGEQLQAITLNEAYYVVLTPSAHVSTAQIFANKQLTKNTIPNTMSGFSRVHQLSTKDLVDKTLTDKALKAEFINDLEKVVCDLYPEVANGLAWLSQFGNARMSGSGASVFLEVTSQQVADKIYAQKPANIQGFVAKGLNQHPLLGFASN